MFLNASYTIFETAKSLRNNQTNTEKQLWDYLKQKPHGYNFRRQHPISTYIADFYCHPLKLIIEIDGGYHLKKEEQNYDKNRQEILEGHGIRFLRFTNDEIEKEIKSVIAKIEEYFNSTINNTSL